MRPFPRSIFLFTLAALGLTAGTARAQFAPIGSHHGGGSSVSGSVGGAAQEVPLALPQEHDGLPVPVAVRFVGGAAVSSAGVGWTVPLSYVSVSSELNHRRPRYRSANVLTAPEIERRVPLVLGGAPEVMIGIGGNKLRPVVGDPVLELSEITDAFELLDGHGVLYRFERLAELRDGPYFLVEIKSSQRTQARVKLRYTVTPVALGSREAFELALTSVEYDFESTGTCGKHRIDLAYEAQPAAAAKTLDDGSSLLGLELLDGAMTVRTRVLRSIAVMARGIPGCSAAGLLRLQRYQLGYKPDGDSSMPRLATVDLFGREGTPEGSRAVPVARYRYGQATRTDGGPHLQFGLAGSTTLPGAEEGIGVTKNLSSTLQVTTKMLADFTGDGLPDLVTRAPDQDFAIARNVGGRTFAPQATVSGPQRLALQQMTQATYDDLTVGNEPIWIQSIDFNGDGRLDIADALNGPAGKWRIYLNEPAATAAGIAWRIIDLDIAPVLELFVARGLWSGDHLPLGLSFTGHDLDECTCSMTTYPEDPLSPPAPGPCLTEGFTNPEPPRAVINENYTMVLWKLFDANGDGYPDLVSNNTPMEEEVALGAACNMRPRAHDSADCAFRPS